MTELQTAKLQHERHVGFPSHPKVRRPFAAAAMCCGEQVRQPEALPWLTRRHSCPPPPPHPGQSSGGGRSRHTECALCCLHAAALLLTQHWHSRWLDIRPPPPSPARCQFGDYRGKWGLVHILLKTLKEKLGVIGPAEVGGPLPVLLLPADLLVVSSLLPGACWA